MNHVLVLIRGDPDSASARSARTTVILHKNSWLWAGRAASISHRTGGPCSTDIHRARRPATSIPNSRRSGQWAAALEERAAQRPAPAALYGHISEPGDLSAPLPGRAAQRLPAFYMPDGASVQAAMTRSWGVDGSSCVDRRDSEILLLPPAVLRISMKQRWLARGPPSPGRRRDLGSRENLTVESSIPGRPQGDPSAPGRRLPR
jgi:hypothetical protein